VGDNADVAKNQGRPYQRLCLGDWIAIPAGAEIEKNCTSIGVNLDKSRSRVYEKCSPSRNDIGAVFVPFSPKIIAYALKHATMEKRGTGTLTITYIASLDMEMQASYGAL
jgi:hypothetical protein